MTDYSYNGGLFTDDPQYGGDYQISDRLDAVWNIPRRETVHHLSSAI
ncbi:MAG TPA: hypothetical protein PKK43_10505 [Spirochaetota bacterium]|nr:hypothetical protein [Spirochaetota bacterium]